MSAFDDAGFHPDNVKVEIRQYGRWTWGATITCGLIGCGELGGPYAMTRERCIKKARRRARKFREDIARFRAVEEVDV